MAGACMARAERYVSTPVMLTKVGRL